MGTPNNPRGCLCWVWWWVNPAGERARCSLPPSPTPRWDPPQLPTEPQTKGKSNPFRGGWTAAAECVGLVFPFKVSLFSRCGTQNSLLGAAPARPRVFLGVFLFRADHPWSALRQASKRRLTPTLGGARWGVPGSTSSALVGVEFRERLGGWLPWGLDFSS